MENVKYNRNNAWWLFINIEIDFSRKSERSPASALRRDSHQPQSAQNRWSQFPSPLAIAVRRERDQAEILDRSCRAPRPHCYAARPLVDSQSSAGPYLSERNKSIFSFSFFSSPTPSITFAINETYRWYADRVACPAYCPYSCIWQR